MSDTAANVLALSMVVGVLVIEVTWFRHGNHPVALLHFQANQPRPTILLRQLELQPGGFMIAGSPPPDANQAALPTP